MEKDPLVPDDALPVLRVMGPLVPNGVAPASGVRTETPPLDEVAPYPLAMLRLPPLPTLSDRPALILTDPPVVVVLRPATIVTAPPVFTPVPELNTKAPLDPTLAEPV